MNNDFNALSNINMIKNTIEEAKIPYSGLYKICFILGIYNTTIFVLTYLSFFIPSFSYIITFLCPILSILLLVGYIIIYNREKNFSNKYYLSIIELCLLMIIAIPFCINLINLVHYFIPHIKINEHELYKFGIFSDVLLFSIFISIYSSITKKTILKILAILFIFIYLLLISCFSNIGIPLSPFSNNNVYLDITGIYHLLTSCIGYIILGFFLKKKVKS